MTGGLKNKSWPLFLSPHDTTTTGVGSEGFTHGGSTAIPVHKDYAQPVEIRDSAHRGRVIAWPTLIPSSPRTRITARYIYPVELDESIVGLPGDVADVVSPSDYLTFEATKRFRPLPPERAGKPEPRTPLGRRLWELRRRILDSGAAQLDWEGVLQEVRGRRGERSEGCAE